jgi:hypothetical protein
MKHSAVLAALALVIVTVVAAIPVGAIAQQSALPLSVDRPLLKWQVQESNFVGDPLVSPNGTTYILVGHQGDPSSARDPMLRSYSSDGALLWTRQMSGRVSLISADASGHAFALEKEDKIIGEEWNVTSRVIGLDGTGAAVWSWENEAPHNGTMVQAACVVDGRTYAIATSWIEPETPSRVFALERNGSLRWTVEVNARLAFISHEPTLGGLLISSYSSIFLMQENGAYERIIGMDGYCLRCVPAVGLDRSINVAVTRSDRAYEFVPDLNAMTELRSYDPKGAMRWIFDMPRNQTEVARMYMQQLICTDDGRTLAVAIGGQWLNDGQKIGSSVTCLNGNGTVEWSTGIDYPYSNSVLYGGRLYVCSEHDLLEMDLGGHVTRRYTAMWLADIHGLTIAADGSFRFLEVPSSDVSTLYATSGFPENSFSDAIINNMLLIVVVVLAVVLLAFVLLRRRRRK